MNQTGPDERGYSLIELLIVLVIVGILSIAGVVYLGNRPAAGVRVILDELEGALLGAQKQAVATGRDITLATTGTWSPANPLVLVRGDSTITVPPVTDPPTPIIYTWTSVLGNAQGTWPPADPPENNALALSQFTSLDVAFRLGTSGTALTREHINAGVAVDPALWVAAQGSSTAITSAVPFNAGGAFAGTLIDANRLFIGAENVAFSISGTNKRFNQTFWIPVVNISNGNAVPGGPMGVIFAQANGGTVYKFYNPGTRNGDGKWRRI
jgi:prepilin-type N-terminal cleavage/methylation domain-containing protein